jgi:hypothetical protein
MRAQVWSVNPADNGRISSVKIHYQKTSSEDNSEEQTLWRAVTKLRLVEIDREDLVLSDL